ncbi:MAG: M20/M25/M40 family metallo-hydrolase, partial [Phycisphaerae bacterium]|nr:M20/M25/M40 family metallo-hydrolase [Phycisphaerae bacterium]
GEWLRGDKDFSDPIDGIEYVGRSNVRVALGGGGGGRSLLLNTHVDAIPPGELQDRPFAPAERDGAIYGRGACDAKGQVAAIWLAASVLRDLGVELTGDLIVHLVVEEENGGNGTVAMIRRAPDKHVDGCVVLEPTELTICPSVRGAVWFRITTHGRSGHPGRAGETVSALTKATRIIEILTEYHDKLLGESRDVPMFEKFSDPMPLVIGKLHAGGWAAAAPAEAVLEGILGMLPNRNCEQVMGEMTEAITRRGPFAVGEDFDIRFLYRHDPMVTPTAHPVVSAIESAVVAAGVGCKIEAMTASCDSWLYNNQLGIPTVVFGAGSLSVAHADDEHIPISELAAAARTLVHMAASWCGRTQ